MWLGKYILEGNVCLSDIPPGYVCFWERIYIKKLTVCICVGNIHTQKLWVCMFVRNIHIPNSRVCMFLRTRTYLQVLGMYVSGTHTHLDNHEYVCLWETYIPRHSCVCIFLGNIHTSQWGACETYIPRFLHDCMSPRNIHTHDFEVCTFGTYIHTYLDGGGGRGCLPHTY